MARISLILLMFFALAGPLKAREINIVPCPESVIVLEGSFPLKDAKICVPKSLGIDDVVEQFVTQLSGAIGTELKGKKSIRFALDKRLAEEEYSIDINANRVKIKASSRSGFLYALTSLSQLLPAEYFSREAHYELDWTLPCVKIKDKPRFTYRGGHLDCVRHFFTVEQVKKYIDILAFYKINRFHWHLTDDHGWRIEIDKYPRLVEVGSTGAGSRQDTKDPKITGEVLYDGYYSKAQIKDIVAYAAAQGITIIPEIDMPSHMTAALAAYPDLSCTRGPYEIIRVEAPRGKGLAKDALCPGRESTFDFVYNVLDEVIQLFPSEYIHIGGDECIKDRWYECPDCQKRMQEQGIVSDDQYTNGQYLQVYFINRVQEYLSSKGRKLIGWDEILDGKLDEGATVMSWRGAETGVNAAKRGFDVVMSPVSHCYLDYRQSRDIASEPRAFAGTVTLEKAYSFDPIEGLNEEEARHILGVQANLWTDVIATMDYVEYMLLPRLAALSEVQWCESKDYERFKSAMNHHRKIYDYKGYIYAKHLWGIIGMPGHEIQTNQP